LNADREVMRHFRGTLTRNQSDAFAERIRGKLHHDGWGLWAVEVVAGDTVAFIGFVGLARPNFEAHFTPAVEVGWRLRRQSWGRGYAPEAAAAAIDFAFTTLGLPELVSLTTVGNANSRRVMDKLGMTYDPADDFENPTLAQGHPLRPSVVYRLRADSPAATQLRRSRRRAV
jgi:RimJ/RimL family protein N-acetyltransferase